MVCKSNIITLGRIVAHLFSTITPILNVVEGVEKTVGIFPFLVKALRKAVQKFVPKRWKC